ncbi:IS5 family transposase [Candidatus Uhrbacteria bacterium]|nr:IS5 family transposase [Candidatus Uhrbacteria bacterium]
MFKSQSSFQSSFFGSFAYQGILDRHHDHFLVRLLSAVDFSFITPLVEECYSGLGRKAYSPLVVMKILLLQTLYDLSERDVIEQVDTNILFRAFVGLSLDDEIPHWTVLGKFRERLGEQRFEEIFNQVVVLAKEVDLLDEKLRILDSTAVKAKVDVMRHVGKYGDDDDDSPTRIEDRSPDPEARTGHKSAHVKWHGYKEHIAIDPSSDIVTAVITTPANVSDVTPSVDLIDKERTLFKDETRPIRQVTGDKGYVGRSDEFKERNILDYTIPRDNMKQKTGNWYRSAKKQRPKIERIFAEGKTNHHLGKCRYWTRWKTHVQSLLTFLTMNLKRITNFHQPAMSA